MWVSHVSVALRLQLSAKLLARLPSFFGHFLSCFVTHTHSHISNFFSFSSPQVQPQALHSPATQSPLPSHPTQARGVTNAPFATRMWWTQSSTPVDTCVSAMPVASNSKRWPTLAAPSAGGQSRISSRPTGARRLVLDSVLHRQVQLKRLSKPCETLQRRTQHVCNLAQVLYSRTFNSLSIIKTLYLCYV